MRIINGEELTLNLSGNNSFISSYNGAEQTNGIISAIPIEIEGDGVLNARGGTSENSVGIDCAKITINSGTVTVYGGTTACTGTITAPDAYTYRINDTDTLPAIGTLYYTGSSEEAYSGDSNIRHLQIISEKVSAVDDIVVSGIMKTALSGADTAVIRLYGDTTNASLIDSNVSAWFTDLPSGITVTANAEAESGTITLTFSGTPTTASAAVFNINIPADALAGGKSIVVQPNSNAKFNIEGGSSSGGGGSGTGNAAILPETEPSADSESGKNNTNPDSKNNNGDLNVTNNTENKPAHEGNQSYTSLILFILLSIALFVSRRIYEEKGE